MRSLDGSREYVCSSCGGVVIGIAVLRRVSGEIAEHIWTAETTSAASPLHCPFCSRDMQNKPVPTGCAAICKLCEVVWLDKVALGALPAKDSAPSGQTTVASLAAQTLHCEQCGAPIANSLDERCQYCGAAIHAPTKVILFPTELPGDHANWERRGQRGLVTEVLDILAGDP